MIDTKQIFRDFLQNDEAVDAEVTSCGVMLSEEDCLTLMDRVVKKLTIPVVRVSLLKKYMKLVISEEGVSLTQNINDGCNEVEFTKDEEEFLKGLNNEIIYEP